MEQNNLEEVDVIEDIVEDEDYSNKGAILAAGVTIGLAFLGGAATALGNLVVRRVDRHLEERRLAKIDRSDSKVLEPVFSTRETED